MNCYKMKKDFNTQPRSETRSEDCRQQGSLCSPTEDRVNMIRMEFKYVTKT
jgi:hypothetical protein